MKFFLKHNILKLLFIEIHKLKKINSLKKTKMKAMINNQMQKQQVMNEM